MTTLEGRNRTIWHSGVALMCASVFFSPIIDIFAKLAGATLSPGEITVARFVVQVLIALALVLKSGGKPFGRNSLDYRHILRGALIVIGTTSIVYSLRFMAVADAIAIFFVEPAILTLLSGIFLKERISANKIIACVAGFGGSLLVIQPSFSEFGFIALLPAMTALAVAIFVLMTRWMAQLEDPWAMQFQTSFWGLVVSAGALFAGSMLGMPVFAVALPDPSALSYLLGLGLSAAISTALSTFAYRASPASVLAPLQYLEIVSASIFAYLVFGDFPNALKWLGIGIIIASGLFIIWREER